MASVQPVSTTVLSSGIVLSATPTVLDSVSITVSVAGYLMVFDSPTKVADGTVAPLYAYQIGAGSSAFEWLYPVRCLTGVYVAFSTTGPFTKTESVAAHIAGQVG